MGAGVAAGTTMPCQVIASNPGMPVSAIVGRSGKDGERLPEVTASARRRPVRTCCMTDAAVANMNCTWPLTRSITAGPPPL
jgi:hypothetical protein